LSIVSMKALLESGVHFGHQTRRWNPKMAQFIFTSRNGIHIIDLQKTMQRLKIAYNAVKEIAEGNGKVLFVGTKKQAQASVVEHATNCGMFYVAERWLGGLLTNFDTVSKSILRLKELEKMKETDQWDAETKKEILELSRELQKKEKVLTGIKDMAKLPEALFIIDPKREAIAVKEARKLRIPIFAVVDTNCNPDEIDYPVPGNDDAIRAIALFLEVMSRAIIEGKSAGQVEEEGDEIDEFDEEAVDEATYKEKEGAVDESASEEDVKLDDAGEAEDVKVEAEVPIEEKADSNVTEDVKVETEVPTEEKADSNVTEDVKVETEVPTEEKADSNVTEDVKVETEVPTEEKADSNVTEDVKVESKVDSIEEKVEEEEKKAEEKQEKDAGATEKEGAVQEEVRDKYQEEYGDLDEKDSW
jgi:small subunit ribosomal protein S2